MLGLPGIPTTDVTRPPPTAGPRLRNWMFSSGSLALLSSSLVGAVDAAFSPSAAGFLSALACEAAEVAPVVFFERSPLLVCAINKPLRPSATAKIMIVLESVFIGVYSCGLGRLTANHIANRGVLYKADFWCNPERSEGTLLPRLTEKRSIAKIAE